MGDLLNKGLETLNALLSASPRESRLRGAVGSRNLEQMPLGWKNVPTKCCAVITGHRRLQWAQLTAQGGLGTT